jgi:hypothetical protein
MSVKDEYIYSDLSQAGQISLIGAATLVVHSSADPARGETHALFPSFQEDYDSQALAFYEELDGLFKEGLGLVVLHYAVWTDKPQSRAYMLDWIGGCHHQGQSKVRVVTAPVRPAVVTIPPEGVF